MKVRTRIAPSPTGLLHIGTARTALFNYLFAKKHNGEFLLRIEDTDASRNTKESYDAILDGLEWLGLNPDFPPTYQSKRNEFYKAKLEELLQKGMAYYSYISEDEISTRKEEALKHNHRYLHRYSPKDEIPTDGISPVIRLKIHAGINIVIEDAVQGRVIINTETIEDFILARNDGSPVYMFAVVCDDIDMQITHIIRGDDHLTNTAKQILLYNAFGTELPVFAHIPLIHGEDGAKLSKRHGAISTVEYKNQGYLPEAIRSYLIRLGWSNGQDNILTDEHAVKAFSLQGIGRSPSRFDISKLQHINEYFIKNSESESLKFLLQKSYSFDFSNIINPDGAISLIKKRSKTLLELMDGIQLFTKTIHYNKGIEKQKLDIIREFIRSIKTVENTDLSAQFKTFLSVNGVQFKEVGSAFRLILIGVESSLGIFDIISVIGFDETKKRILEFNNIITQ